MSIRTPIHYWAAARPYGRIFLLSHMRAYTSLFAHILGSHPEIDGYYELHIGYYSWRSLLRQKLVYFVRDNHNPKRGARFLFDKVLHNDHRLSDTILTRKGFSFILALRPPHETIPSINELYARVDPQNPLATELGAFCYYLDRLETLCDISQSLSGRYLYLDAECLRSRTAETLPLLADHIGVKQPLSEEYEVKPLTGLAKRGDSSSNIHTGHISRKATLHSPVTDAARLAEAREAYQAAREMLIQNSRQHLVMPD
ncbi:hypothetical protein [Ectothiorhodospira marina]|uniref:Sulfotransferase family protein n=1 Tax=Ectothiorhodospira marina TaxID=1396821 RepID=A0A1H7IBK1_9GAMM|nr:hypothetical protein [Ectothiorhodospira marina]SEK59876.1 hypothetical protein SAMN05444515_10395 [Ectothiorhodospira marina]